MPITSRSFVRWNSFLFAIGLLALVVLIGATFWLIARTSDYADAALTARQVRADIADLKSLVQDAESSQRGFLLTANDSYLGPFELARQEIPSKLDSFRVYVTQEPALAEGMAALSTRINAKLEESSNTVALGRAGRTQEALAIVDGGAGQKLMDEARDLFDTLIDGADRRFASSIAAQQDSANALNWVALAATGVILVVVGSAAWIVLNYTRDLASARVEIETLNTGLEEKVRERTVELGRANDEIQRFAYIVTHDLRAPLVNIMGFTSELETSIAPIKELVTGLEEEGREIGEAKLIVAEDLPEAIGFIRSSTRKMDGLINAILKLSREGRRPLKPERLELQPLLGSCVDVIQHQVNDAGGEVTLDIRVSHIVSDRMALEQIVGNMLDNAVKYSVQDRPLRIMVRALPTLVNFVTIEIEDNGRGIAEQDHERVFDLFRRSGTQDKAGEGIGLAHVRSSVRNLGGDITLESRLGEGTTFKINLPRDLRTVTRSNAA